MKKKKLIPPDKKQCQCIHKGSFMDFGIKEPVRCTNAPAYIVTEVKPAQDGRCGSMSLCAGCYEKFIVQMGKDYATVKAIKERHG